MRITAATALLAAVIAALVPLGVVASLANAGTLCAFVAVAESVPATRRRDPGMCRPFRVPATGLVAPFTVWGCCYAFTSLWAVTYGSFLLCNAAGLTVYFLFGRRRARVAG